MFFYILFAVLIARAVEPFSSCDRGLLSSAQNTFNTLSNEIINLDQKIQDTCKQFTSIAAREVFGLNGFRLEVPLPGYDYATFVVKVKHRVIYINGHYPRKGKDCDLTYVDIKVLPEFVSTHTGSWTYKDGQLIVGFDYAYSIVDERRAGCASRYIDETLVDLRRGSPSDRVFSDD